MIPCRGRRGSLRRLHYATGFSGCRCFLLLSRLENNIIKEIRYKVEEKMKKVKVFKVFVAILLIGCCFLATLPRAFAETTLSTPVQTQAEGFYSYEPEAFLLYQLGLFTGTSSYSFKPGLGTDLDRQTGITLLLNFFGRKNEVQSLSDYEINQILSAYADRADVLSWARPYVAYAVKSGIVIGTSPVTLSPQQPINGLAYATMILRQLGYTIDNGKYGSSLGILYDIGGLNYSEIARFNKTSLLKNDAAGIAYSALYARCPDEITLIEKFIHSGIVSNDRAVALNIVKYAGPGSVEVIRDISGIKRPTVYDQVYYTILDALLSFSATVRLPDTPYTDTAQEAFELVERCTNDHPEILYYSGCTYSAGGILTLQYSKSVEVMKEHTSFLMEKTEEIIDDIITPDMTDYQKELAIHDYIITNCDYDSEGFEKGEIPAESFSAYGALCSGTAVCAGYAEAAKLLLDRAGVGCRMVTGTSRGIGHAWNIVEIDGGFYHLDITWDDPVMADGSSVLKHHYFNLTGKEIAVDHQWDQNAYPICNATKYNYYIYNDLVVPDEEEFVNLVTESVQNGNRSLSVKIGDYQTNDFDCNKAVNEVCNRLYKGCTLYFNEYLGIVDMEF